MRATGPNRCAAAEGPGHGGRGQARGSLASDSVARHQRSDHVREDTSKRVLDAMQKLDYRPNPVARALATGVEDARSRELQHHALRTGVDALRARAGSPWGRLLRQHRQPPVARPQRRSAMRSSGCARRASDGILVIAPQTVAAHAVLATAQRHPGGRGRGWPGRRRARGRRSTSSPAPSLRPGTFWISGIEPSGTSPGRMTGSRRNSASTGWRSTLEAAGAPVPPVLVGDWSSSARATSSAGDSRPTRRSRRSSPATTRWRSGCSGHSTRRAATLPGAVSVVGFDDCPEAAYFIPPLTTIRQDFLEVGRRALNLMLEEIESGSRSASAHPCHQSWSCGRAPPRRAQ